MFCKFIFPCNKSYLSAVWKNSGKLLAGSENNSVAPNLNSVRYKARKGTRAAALAAKKARKLEDANKPAPIPKYLQRKVKVSSALEKIRCTDENWLEDQPVDNVWNMKLYRGKPYSLAEAFSILQGMHVPSLLNDPSALVYVTAELDLNLKKKDKFMDEFNGIITYPYDFNIAKKNKIIALCKESADQLKATEAGAIFAGSTTLVKQILSGSLSNEDFDYVVCHPDMYKECNSLRGILKKKFPTAYNGLLCLDVDRAVASFIKGVEYSLKRSALEPDFGWVDVDVGCLDMPFEEIEANLKYALNALEKQKPMGISHLFMIRSLLWCEKTRERIKIPHWEYLPNYPKNGVQVEKDDDDDKTVAERSS